MIDEEALSTAGIIDVLDIVKLFTECYESTDTLEDVRQKWKAFASRRVKEVCGTAICVIVSRLLIVLQVPPKDVTELVLCQ